MSLSSPKPVKAPIQSSDKKTSARQQIVCALTITAVLLWLWYLYTGQIWEDFFITIRHSRNAAHGYGLVFTPGERIHGFTSPLNVLLPTAIFACNTLLTPETLLGIYNVVITLLLLAASVPFYRLLISEQPSMVGLLSWLFLPLMIGLNVTICSFSMNGQEAGFTLAFLGLALVSLWRDEPSAWKFMGLSWGGLMWTRPDSPVLIIALVIASFAFTTQSRKHVLFNLTKSATLCAAIYIPWVLWATWYYGSPIPHTIIAKQLYKNSESGDVWYWLLKYAHSFWNILPRQFIPPYAECGGWPAWYLIIYRSFALLACFYWFFSGKDRVGRSASFVCFVWMLYQGYIETSGRAFPWYFPAAGFTGAIVLMRILYRISARGKRASVISLISATLIISLSAYGFIASLTPVKLRQIYVEDGVRRKLGLWLKDNVRVGEHVYLEPIGYIGYYSNCVLYDYPGLVSPAVVKVLSETRTNFSTCIAYLNPEWLVLRDNEVGNILKTTTVLNNYTLIKRFAPTADITTARGNDRTYALYSDLIFFVFRRNGVADKLSP